MNPQKNTCQMMDGDKVCGMPAIVRVLDHDDHGKERSMYMCEIHFDEVQRARQGNGKDKKEINHG